MTGEAPTPVSGLVDSHCHLDYLQKDGDLDEVLARANRAGVGAMVTICTKISEFQTVREIAERNNGVWCSVGVHPHEAEREAAVTTKGLVELAADPLVVGIGETGLDYFYEHSPRERQQESFHAHIAAARETGLPLIVHSRDADDDMIRILMDEYDKGPYPGVIHCFSSGAELAEKALQIGFYISLSGILTFKRADELRDVAANVPLDHLLVETDAPYLAPIPNRGKRNEPAFVVHTAETLAAVKGIDASTLAAATTENFYRLFNKAKPCTAP
ncbi:MAG: TatD family hydrolase [Rhodospirillaceae bacterium]|jgi:TatD DNase family protein|nr:TatD family hydrolase [Rhodospirillaceae bacterium]MBT5666875.1 TatD family hydrolase [Rhodospirillaceae bacterium]MBT5809341.1 TatD family hydrolase [Rhodospirillaceae bacterium]